ATQPHDRALAELFFDLRHSQVEGPAFFSSFFRHKILSISFGPFRTKTSHQSQFFADKSIKLIRAGRILGKAAHTSAIAPFPRIQGLSHLETFLSFSQPVHLQ